MLRFVLAMVALSLTTVSALAADCRVTGRPSAFGVDMVAYFAVRSGETCKFPIRIPGMMKNSGVSQAPAHGRVSPLNVTTFTYTAARDYKGGDTFAVYGVGEGPYGSGRSVITVNATVQKARSGRYRRKATQTVLPGVVGIAFVRLLTDRRRTKIATRASVTPGFIVSRLSHPRVAPTSLQASARRPEWGLPGGPWQSCPAAVKQRRSRRCY
jgi:hypothetical protein